MINPKNGLYIMRDDFQQWQDYISPLLNTYNKCINDCEDYGKVCGVKENADLRVKNITWVVTEQCDLRCTYCYETHKTGRRMSKKVAKDSIDFIFDKEKINNYFTTDKSPAVILEFIGGEPLLEIDLMNYIVEYFKFKAFEMNSPWATNYMISFSSNGIHFRDDKVQDFIKRNPNKVNVGITIDGNKKLHDACRKFPDGSGSYDIVEKSIKQWLKTDNKPQTKITLSPQNVMFLNDALKNIWSLGIIGAFTNCVFEEGWTEKDATILYKQMIELAGYLLEDERYKKYYCSLFDETIGIKNTETRNWCGGNGEMLAIAPDGKCFPCIRFMKYSLNNVEEKSIGDIYKGLDKKEDNEWLKKLQDITMTSQCHYPDNEKCLICSISKGCSLCVGFDYDTFGEPNHKAIFICVMHQARVLANYYFWTKLYKKLKLDKKFELNIPKEWALKIISEKEYNSLLRLYA